MLLLIEQFNLLPAPSHTRHLFDLNWAFVFHIRKTLVSAPRHFYRPEAGHGLKHDPFNSIVGVHIMETLLEDGVYQTTRAEPVMRGGGPSDYLGISEATRFQISRPK